MTSEEMNRAIEFILRQQAQTSLHLEKLAEYQIRERELLMQMATQDQRMSSLLELQSRRLDRAEEEDRLAQTRHDELQNRHDQLMVELHSGLDRILEKLSK